MRVSAYRRTWLAYNPNGSEGLRENWLSGRAILGNTVESVDMNATNYSFCDNHRHFIGCKWQQVLSYCSQFSFNLMISTRFFFSLTTFL
jgi:hypothetical protein